MRGKIIAIGDELISGRTLNTTSYFAAARLFAAGHVVTAMTTIGDDPALIGRTVQQAAAQSDFVVVTGGLGPTSDDLTTEAIADAFDRPAVFYPEIFTKLKQQGKNVSQSRQISLEKLAWLPTGAHTLHTEAKMAGYFLVQDGKPIFFLPGVPYEMKELLLETVITRLAVWEGGELRQVRQRFYKITGLPETTINELLADLAQEPAIQIGYYPLFPEVHVSLTVTAQNSKKADARTISFDKKIKEILGEYLYSSSQKTLESVVGQELKQQGKMLAVAESCSGGLIAHKLTTVSGSSKYFIGGVVAYSNDLKECLLGVDKKIIEQYGAVSGETACAMALGIRRVTGADLGLAVTGIAGPAGGSKEKPIGTVYIGLAVKEMVRDFYCYFSGDRWQIQEKTCQKALDITRRYLLDYRLP